jgi:O-antigen/teichoic acid export membrane protein
MLGRLTEHRLVRQVAVLMLGTGIAQFVSIVAAPIITRLYEPSALGLSGTLATITSLIAVVASLRFDGALLVESDEEWAHHIFTLSLLALGSVALLTVIGATLCYGYGIGGRGVVDVLPFLPLSLALLGMQQLLERWLARCRAFRAVATAQIASSVVRLAAQIGAGFAGMGWIGLIVGTLVGQVVGVMVTGSLAADALRGAFAHRPDRRQLRAAARRHRQFLLFSAPQVLLSSLSSGIPVLLLQSLDGSAVAGFYFLAMRIIEIPQVVLSAALRPVIARHAAEIVTDRPALYRHFLRVTGVLLAVSLPMVAVLVVAGPQLFAFVFGTQWRHAGEFARWLSIILCMQVVNVPTVMVIPLLNLQGRFLLFEFGYTALRLAALYACGIIGTDVAAVAGYSVTAGVANLVLILHVGSKLRRR